MDATSTWVSSVGLGIELAATMSVAVSARERRIQPVDATN
jgi:hypothetical protein